jgi:DNA-binding transcriptional MerR regulator
MTTACYTIRELSEEFDVTPRTLRFYEEKGLLSPARDGQNRVYDAADRTCLRLILRGKALGFTLEESAELISMYDPASDNGTQLQAVIDKIREKKARVLQQKAAIELLLQDLDEWEQRSLKSLKALNNTRKAPMENPS